MRFFIIKPHHTIQKHFTRDALMMHLRDHLTPCSSRSRLADTFLHQTSIAIHTAIPKANGMFQGPHDGIILIGTLMLRRRHPAWKTDSPDSSALGHAPTCNDGIE
jgi:hypothetical protein